MKGTCTFLFDNGPCLSAKAFEFHTNLVTSSIKRKWNVVAIETKLRIIDQLAKEVIGSLAVSYTIGIIIQLSKLPLV